MRRLARPRPLPPDRPYGPMPAGFHVDWTGWLEGGGDEVFSLERAAELTDAWYAGAECEINTVYGVARTDDEVAHLGLGLPTREVEGCMGRYRHSPDELGIVGHRLTWMARALAAFVRHARAVKDGGWATWQMDILSRLGQRARAFTLDKKEKWWCYPDPEVLEALREAMRFAASWIRPVHGRPAVLRHLATDARADVEAWVTIAEELEKTIIGAYLSVATARKKKEEKEVRKWAKSASTSAAHRATRDRSSGTGFSASADKKHTGERTPQAAADAGVLEWSCPWRAKDHDVGHELLEALEAVERMDDEEQELELPPFTGERLLVGSRKFAGFTGVGLDWLRPRHVMMMSWWAREALAFLLNFIEKGRRWPDVLRCVVEVALGKKAGGARLIGLAPALYRLWARVRYMDIRAALEHRIARPFLDAAPGRGATRSVLDAAWAAELAHTRKEGVATAIVDIKQYDEWIEPAEVLRGCRRHDIPEKITSLTLHL